MAPLNSMISPGFASAASAGGMISLPVGWIKTLGVAKTLTVKCLPPVRTRRRQAAKHAAEAKAIHLPLCLHPLCARVARGMPQPGFLSPKAKLFDILDHDHRVRSLGKRIAGIDRVSVSPTLSRRGVVSLAPYVSRAQDRIAVHCRPMIVRD